MSKGMNIATALQELGLDKTATKADVKQAYKDLARIWHPDRFQNDERLGARTEAKIKLINEARTVAIAYLDKHGHFMFVSRERSQEPRKSQQYEPQAQKKKPPPRPKQAPPRSKKEPPKEEERPKPEDPPKSRPRRAAPPPVDPDMGFHMDQGVLVVIFIVLIMASFLFMLGYSLLNPPEDKFEALTRKIDLTEEKLKLRKEWEARRAHDLALEQEQNVTEVTIVDTFFTLGSPKEWVSEVQGAPLQIKGGEWHYGSSFIRFGEDRVVGWKNSRLDPLKIGWQLDSIGLFNDDSFRVGSSFAEVIALQGSPPIVEGNHWVYGEAIVIIDADTVVSWENDLQNILQAR